MTNKYRLLLIVFSFIVFQSCARKVQEDAGLEGIPEQSFENFKMTQLDKGTKEWDLQARSAKVFSQRTELEDFKIRFYDNKRTASVLSAKNGSIGSQSRDIRVSGDVVISSQGKGVRVETQEAAYSSKSKKIFSESRVRIIKKDRIITGRGFEASRDLNDVQIKDDIKLEMK